MLEAEYSDYREQAVEWEECILRLRIRCSVDEVARDRIRGRRRERGMIHSDQEMVRRGAVEGGRRIHLVGLEGMTLFEL